MLELGRAQANPRPDWVMPGARLDLDFENGRFWDGREHAEAQSVSGWQGGPPVMGADGLECDGSAVWEIGALPGLGQPGLNLALRVDLTETPDAPDAGYLAILHAGSLANRMALLTTRNGIASRLTSGGQEYFSATIQQAPATRYQAALCLRQGEACLWREGQAPVEQAVDFDGALDHLEIGGFNTTLPLKGRVHRLTFWAGLTVPTLGQLSA